MQVVRWVKDAAGALSLGENDTRALLVASLVRFLVLPAAGVVTAVVLRAANSPWWGGAG